MYNRKNVINDDVHVKYDLHGTETSTREKKTSDLCGVIRL